MITYSLFHLWVLGNSSPYYPAKSITHQPLEVTKRRRKQFTSTINMRKIIPWVLAALVDQEVPIKKGNQKNQVTYKNFTNPCGKNHPQQCCSFDSCELSPC